VLQTLAMIQRQAGDATVVAALARRQERELRHWLYDEVVEEGTVKSQLTAVASEVEDTYAVTIDLVVVGDAPVTIELEALLAAAREAITNAAKHSGDTKVNVYAEAGHQVVDVFVRDHGRGFDPAEIGEDRLGIRRSILGRMHRYGGTVEIRSTPGEGTEIHMEMAR
jgi:signal transduction histidine kinase